MVILENELKEEKEEIKDNVLAVRGESSGSESDGGVDFGLIPMQLEVESMYNLSDVGGAAEKLEIGDSDEEVQIFDKRPMLLKKELENDLWRMRSKELKKAEQALEKELDVGWMDREESVAQDGTDPYLLAEIESAMRTRNKHITKLRLSGKGEKKDVDVNWGKQNVEWHIGCSVFEEYFRQRWKVVQMMPQRARWLNALVGPRTAALAVMAGYDPAMQCSSNGHPRSVASDSWEKLRNRKIVILHNEFDKALKAQDEDEIKKIKKDIVRLERSVKQNRIRMEIRKERGVDNIWHRCFPWMTRIAKDDFAARVIGDLLLHRDPEQAGVHISWRRAMEDVPVYYGVWGLPFRKPKSLEWATSTTEDQQKGIQRKDI